MGFTDIRAGDWVDRRLPPWARPWARLARLDRPIGIWLLLLPCWWGVVLAGGAVPDLWLMALFGVGAVVMRGAGCVVNDLFDRRIDREVERTRDRPLASGAVGVPGALGLLVLLLVLGLGVLLLLDPFAQGLGAASLILVLFYPLAKRVTWWPQLVLGLAFNWGALMGWAALRGDLALVPVILYGAGIGWTLAYDTIYACQDRDDDARVGVKSLALRLGGHVRVGVALFMAAALALLLLAGALRGLGSGFFVLMGAAALHGLWQVVGWTPDDPADCLKRFRSNRDFGLLVLAAFLAGVWT